MTCDWCEEPLQRDFPQTWQLVGSERDGETEEFEFCCYTCLMRWVNA
jgi:hypothetical protein